MCIDREKYIIFRFHHRGQHLTDHRVVRVDERMVERVAVKFEREVDHLEFFRADQTKPEAKSDFSDVRRDRPIGPQRQKPTAPLLLLH